MNTDPRDQVWNSVYESYYDAYFEEIVAETLVSRWMLFDTIATIAVALTATGSAVSGWALWSEEGFRTIWAILAGLGALIAIAHSSLKVTTRLKEWTTAKRDFSALRIQFDTLRYRMKIDPQFSIDAITSEFIALRSKYSETIQRLDNDLLRTRSLEASAQDDLDSRIAQLKPS